MAILALEPDPAQALTIRQVVRDIVGADLSVVRSMSELLHALGPDIPDLILLPALLSPGDEAVLLAHLSRLQNSGHVEILVTPFLFATEDTPAATPRGWRRWGRRVRSRPKASACDPRAFAERLMWSLRRAEEVKRERGEYYPAMRDVDDIAGTNTDPGNALKLSPAVVESPATTIHADSSYSDRRAHRRFQAGELQGLRAARIKHGPVVRLVDCSAGGALVETEVPLMPESEAVLELIGEGRQSIVPFRVVRCRSSVVESRLIYWGACVFTQPLKVSDLLLASSTGMPTAAISQSDRFDHPVRAIVERYVSLSDGDASLQGSLRSGLMAELVISLRELSRSGPGDSAAHAINALLAIVVSSLQSGDGADAFKLIECHLHAALPRLTVRFAALPTPVATAGSESLYLTLPTTGGMVPSVLNVELPRGAILEDWQFRLLKASTHLAALLRPVAGIGANPLVGTRNAAISLPVIVQDLTKAGCFVDSHHQDEKMREPDHPAIVAESMIA